MKAKYSLSRGGKKYPPPFVSYISAVIDLPGGPFSAEMMTATAQHCNQVFKVVTHKLLHLSAPVHS